jgi:ribonuclease P protein component
MRKEQRLRSGKDFAAAYREGRIQSNQLLVVRVVPNGGPASRFGFVVGKVAGTAVTRNRIKRRLREAARALDVSPGYDIVIGVRKAAATAKFAELSTALTALLKRSGVLRDHADERC